MLNLCSAVLPALLSLAADAPRGQPPIVVDAGGKEQTLKAYTFQQGVVHLSWLAPADAKPTGDKERGPFGVKVGPQALLLREGNKFSNVAGVVTLVPLANARSVEFDPDKKTATVTAATSADDVKLVGSTAFKRINKFSIEAEVDKGGGAVASIAYEGGTPGGKLKSIKFTATKPAEVKGRPAIVATSDDGIKRADKVFNLTPLYQMPSGRLATDPTLLFKKTLRLDVTKLQKITAAKPEASPAVWNVTPKEGAEEAYTLLLDGTISGKKAVLVGLLGQTPEGWKLFPARRILSIEFDKSELPKEEPEKKDDKKDGDKE